MQTIVPKTDHPHERGDNAATADGGRTDADHPHERGDNVAERAAAIETNGPSPRARGKQKFISKPFIWVRTIPTRAGKTAIQRCFCSSQTDHPHGSGENERDALYARLDAGPSPRERGKPTCSNRNCY